MLSLFFNSLFTYLLQQKTKLNCYKTMICVFSKEGALWTAQKKRKIIKSEGLVRRNVSGSKLSRQAFR